MNKNEQTRLRSLIQTTQEITIVPHPIYCLFKPDTESTKEIKSRLSLPNDKPILLFFGFIRPYKGLSVLIDALHILVNNHDEIHLIIAGEFWEPREKYEQKISALNLTPYIHIFDRYIPDDEAAQFFTVSDLFIAPYTGGTQSGALKSALGFGLPSVVTDIIADELVQQLPELCRTIPSNNPEALADAILRQLSVPVLEQKEIQTLFDRSWQTLVDAASIKVPNDHTTQT
jgi:glycosyltransferase involved in cell wall biosynthesis